MKKSRFAATTFSALLAVCPAGTACATDGPESTAGLDRARQTLTSDFAAGRAVSSIRETVSLRLEGGDLVVVREGRRLDFDRKYERFHVRTIVETSRVRLTDLSETVAVRPEWKSQFRVTVRNRRAAALEIPCRGEALCVAQTVLRSVMCVYGCADTRPKAEPESSKESYWVYLPMAGKREAERVALLLIRLIDRSQSK